MMVPVSRPTDTAAYRLGAGGEGCRRVAEGLQEGGGARSDKADTSWGAAIGATPLAVLSCNPSLPVARPPWGPLLSCPAIGSGPLSLGAFPIGPRHLRAPARGVHLWGVSTYSWTLSGRQTGSATAMRKS
jgi:hypothetical protein